MSSRLSKMVINGTCCPTNSCIKSKECLDERKLRNQHQRSWHRGSRKYNIEIWARASGWKSQKRKRRPNSETFGEPMNWRKSQSMRIRAPVNGFRLHILTGVKRIFGSEMKRPSFWIIPSYEPGNIVVSCLGLKPPWDPRVQRAERST